MGAAFVNRGLLTLPYRVYSYSHTSLPILPYRSSHTAIQVYSYCHTGLLILPYRSTHTAIQSAFV